jgi:hypothetical protein
MDVTAMQILIIMPLAAVSEAADLLMAKAWELFRVIQVH